MPPLSAGPFNGPLGALVCLVLVAVSLAIVIGGTLRARHTPPALTPELYDRIQRQFRDSADRAIARIAAESHLDTAHVRQIVTRGLQANG